MEWPVPQVELPDCQLNWELNKKFITDAVSSALPSSPTNGQRFYYSPAANTYWEFTRLGGIWVFTGGGPYLSGPAGNTSNGTAVYATIAGGPQFVAALAGTYVIQWGVTDQNTGAVGNQISNTIALNGTPFGIPAFHISSGGNEAASIASVATTTMAAGGTLTLQMRSDSAVSALVNRAWMVVLPLRLT